MTASQWAVLVIFFLVYAAIASDRIHKTHAALLGAAVMLVLGLIDQERAFHGGVIERQFPEGLKTIHVAGADWNTIFLLVGMMIIVSITKETGVFQYLAIRAAKLGRGRPVPIIILLSAVTAVLSALLDNVTTVLLIVPVTLLIAEALETDPVPFVCCEIVASNLGGTATLVGDPPNIMIASAADLSFLDFIVHLTPVVLVIFPVFAVTVWIVLGRRIKVTEEQRLRVMRLDETEAIQDRPLLVRCGAVLGITMGGFLIHGRLGLEPATIALFGAAILLLITRKDPRRTLEDVEWPTIFFFFGLFIVVSGLVYQGVIAKLAEEVLALTTSVPVMSQIILWFSAVASAVVDNIPYVATMNPLIIDVSETLHLAHDPQANPLWWALALGACLGGNGTIIGASANVVAAGITGRAGHPIKFVRFLKYGIPLMVESLLISWVYLMWRYF